MALKLTWFYAGHPNWLDFGVGIGIDLVFCMGVENDLVLVEISKLTQFIWGIKLDLISG